MARKLPPQDPGAETPAVKKAPAKAGGKATPNKFKAKADGSEQRRKFLQALGSIKEDPTTIIANDYVERIFETGSIVLDHVLGLKGFPCHGRMIQVHGEEHSGKSTMEYCAAAAYQREFDEPVLIWDFEGQLTTEYLAQCGLNMDPAYLQIRMPDSAEDCLRVTCELLEADACRCFIFDSVGWIMPGTDMKEIRKGKAMDYRPGEQAKAFKKFLSILIPRARKADAVLLFVNQQIGVIPATQQEQNAVKYGTITNLPYTVAGGKAARYTPSIMLETSKGKAFEGAKEDEVWLFAPGEDKAGAGRSWDINQTKIRVLKNKVNNGGYRAYHLYIRPGGGIDDWISVRELAHHYGLFSAVKGKGFVVGRADNPIATYKVKADAIEDVVIKQNMEVLVPLRALVVECIHADDPRSFGYERTALDKFNAGDAEVEGLPPDVRRGVINLEDELGVGTDDVDLVD